MQTMQPTGRVQLLVYDLSRGMATSMSQAILGQQIDGIWHTGILVFDHEYYFGGGIMCQPQGVFPMQHQMPAVRTVDMGMTTKTKADLNAFLMSLSDRFSARTYDLIRNNCNNFSDTVSQFLTGQRIPSYIVDLPNTVFNTPGGQMLRPMIENMQNSVYSQPPIGNDASSSFVAQAPIIPVPQYYPPAKLEEKPMVSSDNKTVDLLGNKIISLKVQKKDDDGNITSEMVLSEKEQGVIKLLMLLVTTSDVSKIMEDDNFSVEVSCQILQKIIANHASAQMSCLFLMRLLVLKDSTLFDTVIPSVLPAAISMIDTVIQRLEIGQGSVLGFPGVPSYVMALCTVANLLSSKSGISIIMDREGVASKVVDIAVAGLSHSRVEIRQMSATVAYNFTLIFTNSVGNAINQRSILISGSSEPELNPLAVLLFCATMENISSEKDLSVRNRRLCVALQLVRKGGNATKSLGRDLGFGDDLISLVTSNEEEKLVLEEMKKSLINI